MGPCVPPQTIRAVDQLPTSQGTRRVVISPLTRTAQLEISLMTPCRWWTLASIHPKMTSESPRSPCSGVASAT